MILILLISDFQIPISWKPNVLFQTKYTVRSNNLSLKYQRFTPSGSKDIERRKIKFIPLNKARI